MGWIRRKSVALGIALVLGAAGAVAQSSVAGLEGGSLNGVVDYARTGAQVGFTALPVGEAPVAMTAGPGDGTVYVASWAGSASTTLHRIYQFAPGSFTTLLTFSPQSYIGSMDLDDDGSLLVLTYTLGPAVNRIYRVAPSSSTPSLILTLPGSMDSALDFTVDHRSGDWLIADRRGDLHRIDRITGAVASIGNVAPPFRRDYPVLSDPHSRDVLSAENGTLFRVDVNTAARTTLTTVNGMITEISFDPLTRGYLVCGIYSYTHASSPFYESLAADGTSIGRLPLLRIGAADGVVSRDGRPFVGLTSPARGTTYRVNFVADGEAGIQYQAAFALSHVPGIRVSNRTIPLTLDPMFTFSLSGAPIFRGMGGVLSATARATVEIDLQPIASTRGLPLHLAAITFDAGGIRRVYGPHTFVIR